MRAEWQSGKGSLVRQGLHVHHNFRIHLSLDFLLVPRLHSNRLFVSPTHLSLQLTCSSAVLVKGDYGTDCK